MVIRPILALWAFLATPTLAIEFSMTDVSARNYNLGLLAQGLMNYYNGDKYGGTPGMFVSPYYWWEAGVAWNTMIEYWYYTGNDSYNEIVKEAMLFQIGQDWDYMPLNQSTTEGNDDHGAWGVAAMAAAEMNFTNPNSDQPGWLYLAQAVFNSMAARWDAQDCGGGLRWQIYTWNNGYNYKNSVSNGFLFHLAARLARYTGNSTYTEWAEKTWNWVTDVQFINTDGNAWPVYDGAPIADNCTEITKLEWTYNSGLFISGCAYLYNHTNDTEWLTRANHIWERALVFFMPSDNVMYEAACQPTGRCNTDERSFKGLFSRFLGQTALMAPSMSETIMNTLNPSVAGVMSSCSGGTDGHTCGLDWSAGKWDGVYGLGEQICALELLISQLVFTQPGPLTGHTGGTSKGNGSAGSSRSSPTRSSNFKVSSKDRSGAGFLTALVAVFLVGSACWVIS